MARLEFAGARYVRNYHLAVPHHELDIDSKKSLSAKPSLDDNLIIHGDNLKALKALLPHYAGKVKCIYIDPPYNTDKSSWIYNDNVNSPRHKEWFKQLVDKECLDRHDRWLSMMTPRLKVLKELLRDDGVIFISIDDYESHHLRALMDEIFGENNLINGRALIWHIPDGTNKGFIARAHEYILGYAKDAALLKPFTRPSSLTSISEERCTNAPTPDNPTSEIKFSKGLRFNGKNAEFSGIIGDKEPIEIIGKLIFSNSRLAKDTILKSSWRNKDQIQAYLKDGVSYDEKGQKISEIYFDERGKPKYVKELKYYSPKSVQQFGWTEDETSFFNEIHFDYPKPVSLVQFLVSLTTSKDDIILDSFAGSGTTAHAVLALNKEDGGNRKFILVEQEEYADTITAERVRRVIKGVKGAKDENLKKGLGGSFSYLTLGDEYDVAKILSGKSLPKYEDMASYVFQTATGEILDRKKIDKKKNYIGSSKFYDVYLFYEPDVKKLKSSDCALKLDFVEAFGKIRATPQPPPHNGGGVKRKRLVFGAVRYVNQETMNNYDVEFCQLPYEVYRRLEETA